MALLQTRHRKSKVPISALGNYRNFMISSEGDTSTGYNLSFYDDLSTHPFHVFPTAERVTSIIWAMKTNKIICSLRNYISVVTLEKGTASEIMRWEAAGDDITAVALSYNEEYLAVGDEKGQVNVWNTQNKTKIQSLKRHIKAFESLDFSPETDLLCSSSKDTKCYIWKITTGELIRTLSFAEHDYTSDLPLTGAKFSKSGDIIYTLASSDFSYLTQWDILDNYKPISSHRIHSSPMNMMVIDIEGFYLGLASEDGWVKIMNTRTMELEQDNEEFTEKVTALAFTTDGKLIVSGSKKAGYSTVLNQHSEGFFSKASKVWMLSIFILWIYLLMRTDN